MRVYRLTARFDDDPEVATLGEFETYDAALNALAKSRLGRFWHDYRIDEYVDGVWQHRPEPPPERRILKPTKP